MASTAKKISAKRKRARGKSRWLVLSAMVLGSAALLAVGFWFIRNHAAWYRPEQAEVAVIEPPDIDLAGVDPAIVRAIEAAREGLNRSPRSAEAWGQLGKVLLAHGFYVPASTCLAQTERLDPTKVNWSYLQGIALITADPPDPTAAIEQFQRAVELGGDVPDVLRLRLGEALLGQDRLEESEQQFQRVLKLNPANARAQLGLARLAVRRGDPETSRKYLERAVVDPHTRKAARLLLVEVQQRLGKELSNEAVHEVDNLPGDDAWPDPLWDEVGRLMTGMKAQLRRVDRLLRQGRTPQATVLLQQIVRDYPESYYAWLMYGKALSKQRNLKAAEQALRTALQLAPDSAETQFQLGVTLYLEGNYRAAETLFRSATEVKPDFAAAHYNLGHCLLQRGDHSGAIEAFRVALRCKADYADAHTSLCQLLAQNGQRAEALAHARLALQYNPGDAAAKNLLQRLLIQIPVPIAL
jgi:protein O-GlcNAc transferase